MSEIEDRVISIIQARAEKGLSKYGVTMERDDLTFSEWLDHTQQELLDAAIYIEKLKEILPSIDGRKILAETLFCNIGGKSK